MISRGMLNDTLWLFIVVGILGGFTTFSAFSHETLQMLHKTQPLAALCNITLSLALCLVAVWFGHFIVR